MTAARAALAALSLIMVALVAAQLVLPGVAERRARSELEQLGTVSDVEVDSFPALKLLLGGVDSLTARLDRTDSGAEELADAIAKADGIDEVRASARAVRVSGLALTDARLAKDGDRLRAQASLSEADLRSFLPPGIEVSRISSRGGELLLVGSFSAFGFELSGPAAVAPIDGAVVLTPLGVPLAGLASVTIFADDRVVVTGLQARGAGDRLVLRAQGALAE